MLVRSESYLPAAAAADSSPSACCLEAVVGTGWRRIIAAIESLSRKIRTAIPTRNATAIAKKVQRYMPETSGQAFVTGLKSVYAIAVMKRQTRVAAIFPTLEMAGKRSSK